MTKRLENESLTKEVELAMSQKKGAADKSVSVAKPMPSATSDEQAIATTIGHDALREAMERTMGKPVEERKGTLYRYVINGGEHVEQFIPFAQRTTEKPLYTTVHEMHDKREFVKLRIYESPSRIYFRADCKKSLGWKFLYKIIVNDLCLNHLRERFTTQCENGSAVETPSQVSVNNSINDGQVWA